jgi:hypothetical protein
MSEAVLVEEPQANPYNANKPWDKSKESPRGLLSPNNTLAYSDPSGKVLDEEKTEATQNKEEEGVPKEETTKYKTVDYKKRRDDLKRHHDKKMAENKAEIAQLKAQLDSKAPKFIPKTPEELATFKEEYSDMYAVVETVAHAQTQEQLEKVNKEIAKLREREMEFTYREAKSVLEKLHPDVYDITETEEFQVWSETQPKVIQDWLYDNATDGKLTARAIDLYKRDVNLSSDKKEETKPKKKPVADAAEAVLIKDAVDPSAGEKKIWTTSEIAALSVYQYEEVSKELDAAFKEGRIVQG